MQLGTLTLYVAAAVAAASEQLQTCSTSCGEQRAKNTARQLRTLIETATATLADNAEAATKLTTTAAASSGELRNELAPVAAVALKIVHEQVDKVKDATGKVLDAAKKLETLATYYKVLTFLTRQATTATVAGTGGSAFKVGTYTTETIKLHTLPTCAAADAENTATGNQLRLEDDIKFLDQKLYAAIAMTCHTTVDTACNGPTSSNKMSAKVTLTTAAATSSVVALSSGGFANIAAGPDTDAPNNQG
ncbi:uncharacterized protein TEOVI_000782700 [Trypanosoma equiperdum]|uniref:Trypanosome variant surface glycoprotein (A-type) n=1 Tax=Trypanosoma equiperdum TaxID=5694 RepID=A0A1G4I277_TRYEQ|nr:hypothetical protein, conserved [Trypanosoma equiperdum]